MIPLLLWFLASVDGACTACREAAGRNALINKRAYYCRALLRGALYAQFAVAVTGLFILTLRYFSNQPRIVIDDLQTAGKGMLLFYVPYAIVVLAAFLIRTIPSVDLRSITSTVIFGPFTLIRPLVAIAGVGFGLYLAPRFTNFVVGLFVLVLMLSMELVLSRQRSWRSDPS